MSLLDAKHSDHRSWIQVGDVYEITKKPRLFDLSPWEAIPFVPMADIPQGGTYAPDFTLKTPAQIRSGTYFERGDILVAKITPSFENGKQALASEVPVPFGFATTEVIPLRPRHKGQDRRLLFFYLLHPDVRHYVAERMEGTTGRQRVPPEVLLDLPFPEFAPEEQRAITDALEVIQDSIRAETRTTEATASLKRATMRELFTRGLRNETQKETEIGPMPESWDTYPLGDLCIESDTVDLRREGDREVEYVDVSSVSRKFLRVESTSQITLSSGPGRARKRIFAGDVIFATVRPTLLRTATVPDHLDDQVCSTAFCVLRRDRNSTAEKFIFYLVQREQFVQQLSSLETGASYPAVTDRIVKDQPVPVPTIDDQREIVAILDAIDRKIDLHRRKRAVLDDLFKALLHKLMTGEIRITELMIEQLDCND
ncbi:MAG: restriction endonuclease subunit S [Caldilineaceae bacterium]|nr:restriction endonuclease subunit S [Caldilineaceae bacterium]